MNTVNNSAQVGHEETNVNTGQNHKPMLAHRLPGEYTSFFDGILASLERAAGIAEIMEAAFVKNMASEISAISLYRAAEAIRLEVKDAEEIAHKYWQNS